MSNINNQVLISNISSVKKIHKLEADYRTEGNDLEVELGQHLVRNVKGLLRQGLVDMQKKMVQDVVSKNVNYSPTSKCYEMLS